jgi:capsular polysaccharide biosynthesis protein
MGELDHCEHLIASGRLEEAQALCLAALERNGSDDRAWFWLGWIAARADMPLEAGDFFGKAFSLAPHIPEYLHDRVLMALFAGEDELAVETLRQHARILGVGHFQSLLRQAGGLDRLCNSQLLAELCGIYFSQFHQRYGWLLRLTDMVSCAQSAQEKLLAPEAAWSVRPLQMPGFKHITPDAGHHTMAQHALLFRDVWLVGGADIVIDPASGECVCDSLFRHASRAGYEQFGTLLLLNGQQVFATARAEMPEVLAHAVSFLGWANWNYAHWVLEKLPRFYWLQAMSLPAETVLLIESGLPDSIYESLAIFWQDRPVLQVPAGAMIRVHCLHHLSNTADIFEPVPEYAWQGTEFALYPRALGWLRTQLLLQLGRPAARRLYLPRMKTRGRHVVDEAEIVDQLTHEQFLPFHPEDAVFLEQVAQFSVCPFVLGSSGAAFANLLFMPAGSRALIITKDLAQSNFWFFHYLAEIAGVDLSYFCAQAVPGSHTLRAHENIRIDFAGLKIRIHELLDQGDSHVLSAGAPD